MRHYFLSSIISISSLVVVFGPSQAADKLYVQTPADRDPDAPINERVKEECAIESRVSFFVQEAAKTTFDVIPSMTLADAANNKALSLTVLSVEGIGGGGWTGSKRITLRGTLTENGNVAGTFVARRSSRGGVLGPMQGTCSIFERDAKELGQDIAKWLVQPSTNARLGELN